MALKALLEPFGITRYFTDGWGAYERHVEAEQHTVGKANTQKIRARSCTSSMRVNTRGLPGDRHKGKKA